MTERPDGFDMLVAVLVSSDALGIGHGEVRVQSGAITVDWGAGDCVVTVNVSREGRVAFAVMAGEYVASGVADYAIPRGLPDAWRRFRAARV